MGTHTTKHDENAWRLGKKLSELESRIFFNHQIYVILTGLSDEHSDLRF